MLAAIQRGFEGLYPEVYGSPDARFSLCIDLTVCMNFAANYK